MFQLANRVERPRGSERVRNRLSLRLDTCVEGSLPHRAIARSEAVLPEPSPRPASRRGSRESAENSRHPELSTFAGSLPAFRLRGFPRAQSAQLELRKSRHSFELSSCWSLALATSRKISNVNRLPSQTAVWAFPTMTKNANCASTTSFFSLRDQSLRSMLDGEGLGSG